MCYYVRMQSQRAVFLSFTTLDSTDSLISEGVLKLNLDVQKNKYLLLQDLRRIYLSLWIYLFVDIQEQTV